MNGATILYLDDEIDQFTTDYGGPTKYIQEYLRTLDPVRNGNLIETADLFRAEDSIRDTRFDLLILDIRIPPASGGGTGEYRNIPWERTGVELIRRVRAKHLGKKTSHSVPIIVVTAVAHTPTLEKIETEGRGSGNDFIRIIQKPPRLVDIGSAVKEALRWGNPVQ